MASYNGGRSPKDLHHLLNVARQDTTFFPEEIEENLGKLKSLSKDETSENAMLRDRIDQQSELICILKKQADTSLIKSQTIEQEMKELLAVKEEAECNYHDQVRKYSVLERRFKILFQNHEEIIKIKDGYKVVNDELRRENKNLITKKDKEVTVLVEEKNEKIRELEIALEALNNKFHNCNGLLNQLQEESIENERHFNEEFEKLKSKAVKFEERALEMEKKALQVSSKLSLTEKEVTELQEDISHKTQATSEQKETICKQEQKITELRGKVHELELLLKKQSEKFAKEMEDASANAQVRKLKALLRKADDKVVNHDKEFEAYKTHTEKLLLKERELNSKLRQIIG
ncbi:coiled-coil domain-containing protein 89-like [Dendronephthya gigantea]|uniref:coiled-coil domain-containing protein 89-like n=1 Tax=Dendronephthya gigantea TaxID=151771 RepID=UPI00106D8327|nr:coiled-coil domain-containing protein 89-like [Dendronephthya gigantea]